MEQKQIWRGMGLGFIAVCCFSFTLPLTKIALHSMDPIFVASGRIALAGVLSIFILLFMRAPWPSREQWKAIAWVAAGTGFGFPVFTTLALRQAGAAHGGIVLAILPLFTSILGSWLNREKHPRSFWMVAFCGCLTVFSYIYFSSGISLETADLWLLCAAASAAVGYTVGARVSKVLGGLVTICWAVVLVLPLSLPVSLCMFIQSVTLDAIPWQAWGSFLYIAIVSQLFAFMPWYAGLRMGGIARVSQVQLLQVFMTLLATAWTLSEPISWTSWLVAGLVMSQVYIAKKLAA